LDVLGGFWHLANFFAPALGMALFATLLAKLLWWRDLRDVPWGRLLVWGAGAAALVCIVGLVVFGRDGKMITYGAMVVACALGLWWVGFGARRR